MDDRGRPDHIEDYLARLHSGSWYGWSNSKNKVYSNLIIHPRIWNEEYKGNISADGMMDNPHSKPTKKECEDGLKTLQDEWDLENNSYKSNRKKEYGTLVEQIEFITENGIDAWQTKVQQIKTKYPKE